MKVIINIFLFVILIVSSFQASAKTNHRSSVFFNIEGAHPLPISIYEPIDGMYNSDIETKRLNSNGSVGDVEYTYTGEIPAQISGTIDNRDFNIFLLGDDSIQVAINLGSRGADWIKFSGSNAAGQDWYNKWRFEPGKTSRCMGDIFDSAKTDYPRTYNELNDYSAKIISGIDSIKRDNLCSKEFYNLSKTDILCCVYEDALQKYNMILSGRKYGKLSSSDSTTILNMENNIFVHFNSLKTPHVLSVLHGFLYVEIYLRTTNRLTKFPPDTLSAFGDTYAVYSLLPPKFQKPILGDVIVVDYQYNVDEFNKDTAIAFFRKRFPESEYLPIIEQLKREKLTFKELPKEITAQIHLDTSTKIQQISTLKELYETYFKGKKIFIDMWASWCIPCKAEFAYSTGLDSLAQLHHVSLVFLSIDEPRFANNWKEIIYSNKLKGFHFRAGEELQKDIQKEIYGKESFSVPRYIYIDEKGIIINQNAPRPSSINELNKLFSTQTQ